VATYNIHQAKTHFSKLVDRAATGEDVVIAKAGKPVAKLVSVGTGLVARNAPRPLGLFTGKYLIPDDFDAPLPDKVMAEFTGPLFPVEPRQ
jgi:prevent-host-death family protein